MRFKLHKGNDVLAGYANTIQEAQEQCDINKGWYYKLPEDVNRQELIRHITWLCVNKQLEPFGITDTDIRNGGKHEYVEIPITVTKKFLFIPYQTTQYEKVIWYQYYTFKTEEEFNNWKKFCIETFRKYLKLSKEKAESEFSWFNLAVGLKQEYLHERNTD